MGNLSVKQFFDCCFSKCSLKFAVVLFGAAVALFTAPVFATETITYTYDTLGRMVEVESSGSVNDGQVTTTSYDDAGNRTNYAVTGAKLRISIADAIAVEGDTLSFAVTISGAPSSNVTVQYATSDGTAIAINGYGKSDYSAASNSLTFTPSGQLTQFISVSTVDDDYFESDETFIVTLSNATGGAVLSDSTATGTIENNDAYLSLNGGTLVVEGEVASLTVTRAGDTTNPVSASYATADGTAVAGSDYTAVNGIVSFASGVTSQTISVTTLDDSTVEPTETFLVSLFSPSNGAMVGSGLGEALAVVVIHDNDEEVINLPPIANPDSVTMGRGMTSIISVRANDTDPEGNYPLVGVSANIVSGNSITYASLDPATAMMVLTAGGPPGNSVINYIIEDSLGAQSQGTVYVTVKGLPPSN